MLKKFKNWLKTKGRIKVIYYLIIKNGYGYK